MNSKHQEWLEAFLKNCHQLNKSEHTVKNYRCDLIKYITWFEHSYPYLLNHATAQNITRYKDFLAGTAIPTLPLWQRDLQNYENNVWWRFRLWAKAAIQLFKRKRGERIHSLPPSENRVLIAPQLAVASKKRHLSAIKNFYQFLKEENEDRNQLFLHNPVKTKIHGIRLKDKDTIHTTWATPEDWKRIDQEIYRPKERLIMHLLYFGGLRLTELTRLRFDSLNVTKETLTFERKGGDIHELKLRKFNLIFRHWETYRKSLNDSYNPSDFLFSKNKLRPISSRSMYNLIMKILKKAGCPSTSLTPHSFRKSCATALYYETKDLLLVRDYLNHQDAKVTQTYIETR